MKQQNYVRKWIMMIIASLLFVGTIYFLNMNSFKTTQWHNYVFLEQIEAGSSYNCFGNDTCILGTKISDYQGNKVIHTTPGKHSLFEFSKRLNAIRKEAVSASIELHITELYRLKDASGLPGHSKGALIMIADLFIGDENSDNQIIIRNVTSYISQQSFHRYNTGETLHLQGYKHPFKDDQYLLEYSIENIPAK